MGPAIQIAVAAAEPTDEQLVSRLGAGDIGALGQLFVRHKLLVGHALRRFAPAAAAAEIEELVQDVFLALPKAAARYEERTRFKAWLFGIAVRTARHCNRRAWVRRERSLRVETGEASPLAPAPDQAAALREEALLLLGSLPPGQREVLVLHAVEGFDGEEIARILGISPGTVWTRLHRARQAVLAAQEAAVPIRGAELEVER